MVTVARMRDSTLMCGTLNFRDTPNMLGLGLTELGYCEKCFMNSESLAELKVCGMCFSDSKSEKPKNYIFSWVF